MHSTRVLIQKYYDLFNQKKLDDFITLLHSDVIHDINQGQTEVGKDLFIQFMKRMNHCYDETVTSLIIMVSENQLNAAAEFTVMGTYIETDSNLPPANGQQYSILAGCFFEIKDTKIYRVTNYYNLNEWLKQITHDHP